MWGRWHKPVTSVQDIVLLSKYLRVFTQKYILGMYESQVLIKMLSLQSQAETFW
jgi:hypothetical protein